MQYSAVSRVQSVKDTRDLRLRYSQGALCVGDVGLLVARLLPRTARVGPNSNRRHPRF